MVAVARHVAEAVGEQELAALLHAGAGVLGAVGVRAHGDDVPAQLAVAAEDGHGGVSDGVGVREAGAVELDAAAVLDERAQQRVDAVAEALHVHLDVEALAAHVAAAVADVGHDVEAGDGGQLDELLQVAVVEGEALFLALVLEVVEVALAAQVVQRAEDEVVLRHGVHALAARRVVVGLAQLEPELYLDALRGLLHGLDELVALDAGQEEVVGAQLQRLRRAEVAVVGEADLRDAALELRARHLRHARLAVGVKRAAAVYVVIGKEHKCYLS